ncbi:MAG: metal-binding protein, partial [Propionibacteriales bacterium]
MNSNPLVLDTHELPRRAGSSRNVDEKVPAPEGMSIAMIGVPADAEMQLQVLLEAVGEGILATGNVTTPIAGECSRCLQPFEHTDTFDFVQLFYYPGRDSEEDALFVADDRIDLTEVVRDAIVLDLPFTPLCGQNCAGLCSQCGVNLNDEPDHTHAEATDARWDK